MVVGKRLGILSQGKVTLVEGLLSDYEITVL